MYRVNKKRFAISLIILTILITSCLYAVSKGFKHLNTDYSPNAPGNESIETSFLLKKVKNPNIINGYIDADNSDFKVSNIEQNGEKPLTEDQYLQIGNDDKDELSIVSSKPFITQRFTLNIKKDITNTATLPIKWQGKSNRIVDIYGWDYNSNSWIKLKSSIGRKNENITISADINTSSMIKDSTANILVKTAKENSILKGSVPEKDEYDFTFAWLSDTQYYSASYPEIYQKITKYIADNKKDKKIIYAMHTGDLVDNMDDQAQWKNADISMSILDKAGIPYGVLAGNHDVGHTTGDYTQYYRYFGQKRFINKPTFGGTPNDNRDHYDLISASGKDYIILYLGWGIKDDTKQWANDILKKYPDRKAIICIHGYLSSRGSYVEQGKEVYDKIVSQNKNVFMVLCGHYGGAMVNVKRNNGNVFYEMIANYQFNAEGGAGYLRLLHFDTKNDLVYVNTYSPYKNDYNFYEDAKDEFILPFKEESGEISLSTNCLVF